MDRISEVQKVAYIEMQQHMVQLQHQQHMSKTLTHYIPTLKVPQVITSNGQHLLENHLGAHHIMDHTNTIQNFAMMPSEESLRPIAWAPDYSVQHQAVAAATASTSTSFMGPSNSQSQHTQTNFPDNLDHLKQSSAQNNQNPHKNKPKIDNNNKSFTCTECGKGLARKDKLVIHMRIHTGEKPYVCEICKKAFARRDKLVIHMNKLKHITPSNLAPLGKRSITVAPASSSTGEPNNKTTNNSANQNSVRKVDPKPNVVPSQQQLWRCDTCGRCLSTREEWMSHTRAHLESNPGSSSVSHPLAWPPPPSVATAPQYPITPEQQHFCLMCRQEFPDRTEFMFHLRTHFKASNEHQNNALDTARLCT